jgi:hypothetical protein
MNVVQSLNLIFDKKVVNIRQEYILKRTTKVTGSSLILLVEAIQVTYSTPLTQSHETIKRSV